MKKSFKILILITLFFVAFSTIVNASSIIMDLEDYTQNNTNIELENTFEDNTSTNNVQNQNVSETQSVDEDDTPRTTSSTTVSNNDEFLTVENILSIIIIVIGLLLIFLAIAILIRFK